MDTANNASEIYKKNLTTSAHASIQSLSDFYGEITQSIEGIRKSIKSARSIAKTTGNNGVKSLGDIDKILMNYSSRFLDDLTPVLEYIEHLKCSKMEKNEDFSNFDNFSSQIVDIMQHLKNICLDIAEFHKNYADPVHKLSETYIETLKNGHKHFLSFEFTYICTRVDALRRVFDALVKN